MKINFHSLQFEINDDKIYISSFGDVINSEGLPFCEIHIAGEDKDTHLGAKLTNSSEGKRLKYVSHEISKNQFSVIQASQLVKIKTVFREVTKGGAIRVFTEITSISDEPIIIEEASSLVLSGIGKRGIDSSRELFFTRFRQSHHAECQPERRSFFEHGLYRANTESQKRLAFANIGSWSTKEEIPQGIIEEEGKGALAFAIESSSSWYYEIADVHEKYYLWLGGPSILHGDWSKKLHTGETYRTPSVLIAESGDAQGVIEKLTLARREARPKNESDSTLPVIFNEYMHLSWDSPTEENTQKVAPIAADLGAEYYVIDCGWHDEEPGCEIYPYVGAWRESAARFPSGIKKTTDFIRSLGMKAGLWIEPEIIGIKCKKMLEYYDDSCFLSRYGKKISVMGRYFLDYRSARVCDYMSETIRRMIEDYGADYIKFDYNEDMGIGTDKDAFTRGEGLEDATRAFFSWVKEMTKRYPDVVFEGCASGGMRMDGNSLSHFSLVSTSDQVNYTKYPYIASNILSAVIPEQAAVWSYPVTVDGGGISVFYKNADWVSENISDDKIAMNMINSLLGRMHLASHVDLLNPHQLSIVKEGIDYYKSISDAKCRATPVFPLGFSTFGDSSCASGFVSDGKLYLAAWCLSDSKEMKIPIKGGIKSARIAYPAFSPVKLCAKKSEIILSFTNAPQAVFLEIEQGEL